MRSLRHPPPLGPDVWARVAQRMGDLKLREFVSKANAEYYHWNELRHRIPDGFAQEEAWAAVKLSRFARRNLPLLDAAGKPFSYWLPDQAQEIIHIVDRRGGGTLAAEPGMPDIFSEMRERVLIDSLMEEAIATSQIEGAVTTRKVAKEMLRSGRKPKPPGGHWRSCTSG